MYPQPQHYVSAAPAPLYTYPVHRQGMGADLPALAPAIFSQARSKLALVYLAGFSAAVANGALSGFLLEKAGVKSTFAKGAVAAVEAPATALSVGGLIAGEPFTKGPFWWTKDIVTGERSGEQIARFAVESAVSALVGGLAAGVLEKTAKQPSAAALGATSAAAGFLATALLPIGRVALSTYATGGSFLLGNLAQ